MTEAEWLASTSVGDMLRFLRGTDLGPGESARTRKYRLFVVVCARRAWHSYGEVDRDAGFVAEKWADKLATEAEVHNVRMFIVGGIARKRLLKSPRMAAIGSLKESPTYPLLRDIFGNPFRPVTFAPSPLSPSPRRCTKIATSATCPSWPTLCKTRGGRTRICSITAAGRGRISEGAGSSTS